MLTNLLPLAGGMAVANTAGSADQFSTNADNSFDPLGYGGALSGAALGGLGGYFGGKAASKGALKKLAALGDVSKGGKLVQGKGKLLTSLAKNPKLAAGGGAALGMMLGSQMLGKAFTGARHEETAQQMQMLAQQDAERQQRNLMALSRPTNVRY